MNLQNKLNQEGMRLTRPRQAVMEILMGAKVPLSPQSIHQRSMESDEEIGLVTVYRTLDLLAELGLVRRVHDHDECQGYVLASPGHHHHLICRKCGKAVEFTGEDDLTSMLDRIRRQTGYNIDEHILQLYGLCPKCQEVKHEKKK